VGERGACSKGCEGVRRWLENAWTWACPQRGCGQEVWDGEPDGLGPRGQREGSSANRRPALTERVHRTERERMGASARGSAPTGLANRAARGREGERARVRGCGWSLTGEVHLSGDAGARAFWLGRAGLKSPFLFLGNF
jgi:hypothetical protein